MSKILYLLLFAIIPFQGIVEQNILTYPIKSGMLKYKLEGRTNGSELIYFDNYGALFYLKEIRHYSNEQTSTTLKVLCCDTLITINESNHTAQVQIINQQSQSIKDNIVTPEMLSSLGYIKTGKEVVSGVDCDKYEGDNGTIWIWQNLIFKTEMLVLNTLVKKEVVEFNPKLEIAPAKFKVPADYTIIKIEK